MDHHKIRIFTDEYTIGDKSEDYKNHTKFRFGNY